MNGKQIGIYQRPSSDKLEQNENKKISYWLGKLHRQEKGKNLDKKNLHNIKQTPLYSKPVKSPETEGLEQHAKELTMKVEEDKQKVDELVRKSNRSVITVSSIFPWDLFPDTIDVEEGRVTFVFRQFLTSQTHSVDIKDISNIFIESGLFFSTLQVVSRTFVQNDIKISFLNTRKAIDVKNIIEGLRTFAHDNIDTSNYEVPVLLDKLYELQTVR